MAFIKNVSISEINSVDFANSEEMILIQISDPCSEAPVSKSKFSASHQFEFLDAEDDAKFDEAFLFSDAQAKEIIQILNDALSSNKNVIVHCHAGICRSGAVAEVGVMLGFDDTGRHRQPNLRVKHKLLEEVGYYDQWK